MPEVPSACVLCLQLDLITDLLGTPSLEAMRTACEGAKAHILRGPHKQVPVLHLPAWHSISAVQMLLLSHSSLLHLS